MNSPQPAPTTAKLTPNLDLRGRNTFGFDSRAELAYEITDSAQIPALMKSLAEQNLSWQVLGGGSNVVLPAPLGPINP